MPAFTESYTTRDKTDWGDGPWQHEPDKVVWIDEATGLDCMIVRNPVGSLCGYVGVPEGHDWFEADEYVDVNVNVHGGLTFARRCQEDDRPDAERVCHTPQPGRPEVFWLGFDCFDVSPARVSRDRALGLDPLIFMDMAYRDLDYVIREVQRLADQVCVQRDNALQELHRKAVARGELVIGWNAYRCTTLRCGEAVRKGEHCTVCL